MAKKLILKSDLSLGDIVVMTAAVRELHLQYPGQFCTDVRTYFPGVWESNPYITPIDDEDPEAELLRLEYPLINVSNQRPYHFLHGYIGDLSAKLGLPLYPTAFRGDVHLSSEEKSWYSQVHEITAFDTPFWVIAAGGKFDFTIKWWSDSRFQKVVDHFQGRILFVQVGEAQHHHPPLRGVIDLRGKTDTRQLIRLIYNSQGVLCPVTSLMHLAAAVEMKGSPDSLRPCVVVAGGREPPHWEEYPGHQFLHTIGALDCCSAGGCWRSRTLPLGDGDEKDEPGRLCIRPMGGLPTCMAMITPEIVIQAIETYISGGKFCLKEWEAQQVASIVGWHPRAIKLRRPKTDPFANRGSWSEHQISELSDKNAVTACAHAVRSITVYPESFRGRGIVICGGGLRYMPSAWINIRLLRSHGCKLPIELWHLEGEIPGSLEHALKEQGVACRVGNVVSGWELKTFCLLHSSFEEILYLDADNFAVRDPTYLFETKQFKAFGAVFWPDYGRYSCDDPVWAVCGVRYVDEPQFESGQILIKKQTCWKALNLAHWYNQNAAFFYRYFLGDKETFHFAFRFLEQPYSMPKAGIVNLDDKVMCQHDFEGNRLFQHRNRAKWKMFGKNPTIPDFLLEKESVRHLRELRRIWDGRLPGQVRWGRQAASEAENVQIKRLTISSWYLRLEGEKVVRIRLGEDGRVLGPSPAGITFWDIQLNDASFDLALSNDERLIGKLTPCENGWHGTIRNGGCNTRIKLSREENPDPLQFTKPPKQLITSQWVYRLGGSRQRTMTFGSRGEILEGAGNLEFSWELDHSDGAIRLFLCSTEKREIELIRRQDGDWSGTIIGQEKRVAELLQPRSGSIRGRNLDRLRMSRAPRISDWQTGWFKHGLKLIKEKPRFHRKQWQILSVLSWINQLCRNEKKQVVIVDPGGEPLADALAAQDHKVKCIERTNRSVDGLSKDDEWCASVLSELNERSISDVDAFRQRVSVHMLNSTKPEDFNAPTIAVFANCEDFRKVCLDTPFQLLLVDNPNIQAVALTGDAILKRDSNNIWRIDDQRIKDAKDILSRKGFAMKFDFGYGDSLIEQCIDVPPYQDDHHMAVRIGDVTITSYTILASKII